MAPDRADACSPILEEAAPGLSATAGQMCSATADPDQALALLADLSKVWDLSSLDPGVPGWVRVIALLGGSPALGRWLCRRPSDIQALFADPSRWEPDTHRADLLAVVEAALLDSPDVAADELRWAYRRHMMRIAARDLTADDPLAILETTCEEISDLDDAVVDAAVRVARAMVPDHETVRFAVVALGKTGAREANYVSDVDVLYLAEPVDIDGRPACSPAEAARVGTRLAAAVTRICSGHTAAGTIFPIDANLRPEGAAGPLVRTRAAMRAYYTTWAKNWEYQAMLKARAMAGDLDLAHDFQDAVGEQVWSAAERDGFVSETQAMRARVVSLIPAGEADREIKLSAGGLRDTEFSVQMLQLVHGRSDERLRVRATLPALSLLVAHGYVGRADGARLDEAYRFQRLLEHRLQLFHMRRTHLMPADDASLRRLARSVGMREGAEVVQAWRSSARTVLALHQKIYYSPLLEAVARIPTDEIRLTADAAATRLKALGYADPNAALRHIESLTQGMSRKAEILRQLLPALLGWLTTGPNPDAGLLAFRQMAEALGSSPFFLRALRDEGQMAQNLARVLSTSRYAASLLRRSPTSVDILIGDSAVMDREALALELSGVVARYGTDPRTSDVIRATRRRELLRVAVGDILGQIDVEEVGRRLTDVTSATVEAALETARASVAQAPVMAIIALGRWGGQEMSYSSDADLMVVVADSDDPEAVRKATQVLATFRKVLSAPGLDPDLEIDMDLRPEGKDGPLVRSLSSTIAYYEKWSAPWEAQALLRARHGAGDPDLSAALLTRVDPIRYPLDGLSTAHMTQIRRLKARMETERIPKGIDPRNHVKLGPGGLSDVEWTVQCLQLAHTGGILDLRTTSTVDALDTATQVGIIDPEDAEALRAAFLLASRIRNAITILRDKPSDLMPVNASDLDQVGQILGYAKGSGSHVRDDWHKLARRARVVVDRLFWGQ